jgi:hypothetical protein
MDSSKTFTLYNPSLLWKDADKHTKCGTDNTHEKRVSKYIAWFTYMHVCKDASGSFKM